VVSSLLFTLAPIHHIKVHVSITQLTIYHQSHRRSFDNLDVDSRQQHQALQGQASAAVTAAPGTCGSRGHTTLSAVESSRRLLLLVLRLDANERSVTSESRHSSITLVELPSPFSYSNINGSHGSPIPSPRFPIFSPINGLLPRT
jgi:hypothetical protein